MQETYCLLPLAYCLLPITCTEPYFAVTEHTQTSARRPAANAEENPFASRRRRQRQNDTGILKDDFKSYLSFHLLKSTKYIIMHRNNSVHSIKDDVPVNADEVMCVDWSS